MIDQEKVKSKIAIIKESLNELEKMRVISLEELSSSPRDLAAAKYFIRTSIEAMIDIGSHIVAKKLLGVPSTNVEVILLLADKGVVAKDNAQTYVKMAKYRNRLTHFYNNVSVSEICDIIQNHLGDFEAFIKDILQFLEKNL
jgi:uncharacterized protein YutE (UPF0331/DUF86 family)